MLLIVFSAFLIACGDDAAGPDIAPGIQAVFPRPNATGVSLSAELTAEFSAAIATGDNSLVFTLTRSGEPVAAQLMKLDGHTLRMIPGMLEPGQTYEVALDAPLVDASGRRFRGTLQWSFATTGHPLPALERAHLMLQLTRLAHDSMAGRGSGTADELRSANYIAQQFQAFGLQPPPGAYLMQFTIPPARVAGRTGVTSQNVIGVLPGEGALKDQWVVIGAHYDHVGIRTSSEGITQPFNGADDNASGTAVVLQLASHLAAYFNNGGTGNEPRRSLMFQAFGAEELGLIGSEHYCAQPSYPLTTVTAMLNFDMVGRMRDRTLMVGGLATATEWSALLARHNLDGLTLTQLECSACTDFACFRRNQRPTVWFYTGTHSDYHKETDDAERINAEGLGQVADLAARLIVDVVLRRDPLAFKSAN